MTANERYEKDWADYVSQLNFNPTLTMRSFLKSRHTNLKGMSKWMERNDKSVKAIKRKLAAQHQNTTSSPSQPMFVPVSVTNAPSLAVTEQAFSHLTMCFPGDIKISVDQASPQAVALLLNLYTTKN